MIGLAPSSAQRQSDIFLWSVMQEFLVKHFPVTWACLLETSENMDLVLSSVASADDFFKQLRALAEANRIPGHLPDLARVELANRKLTETGQQACQGHPAETYAINPSLQLLEVQWAPLLPLLDGDRCEPASDSQILLFWQHPGTGEQQKRSATAAELLALKLIAEQLDPEDVASHNNQPVGVLDAVLDSAVRKGLILAPSSKLRRQHDTSPETTWRSQPFLAADVFTLQWHITHRCDLHCRHCYDRSDRKDVTLQKGLEVLDQLRQFCRTHHVDGQVSFSGGNPFMHPDFLDLYRAAHERNLNLAILGNPVSEAQLDAVLQIARPSFFQVSLEGLEEHNDQVRGKGSFWSVMEFLAMLKKHGVYSMVMLTLTRDNMDQVLPLADILRERVDLFTYNRLAMVGEGADLETPHPEEYQKFVVDYLKARRTNPVLALKDSLINIALDQQRQELFGGCTGFGCGAAFNFVSVLPDGQVHACRKFPSLIGNLNRQTLHQVYHSSDARKYRQGCRECSDCHLRLVCGGCLAVTHGWGRDPLRERDPDCFLR